MPCCLGAAGCAGPIRGKSARLLVGRLSPCPGHQGWIWGPSRTRPEAAWGRVNRAAGSPGEAPRARLRPRSAAGQGTEYSWGLIPGPVRQNAAALRGRRLAGDPTRQPMLNVTLGIPRGLWQGLGLAGSLARRPSWGPLGLGLYRLPCFARTDCSLSQACGLRALLCRAPIPERLGCPGAPRPVRTRGHCPSRVAPAERPDPGSQYPFRARRGRRPGPAWLARPHGVQWGPRIRGRKPAPGPEGRPDQAASAHWGPGRAGR